jgi:hypothetical protein
VRGFKQAKTYRAKNEHFQILTSLPDSRTAFNILGPTSMIALLKEDPCIVGDVVDEVSLSWKPLDAASISGYKTCCNRPVKSILTPIQSIDTQLSAYSKRHKSEQFFKGVT